MGWNSPEDAMPWVGLYVCLASFLCIIAMAADAFEGFRQWKLWFPCKFFTINAASLTLIAIAMKLPVDLTTNMSRGIDSTVKLVSIMFLVTMLANFLPSLGLMNDKELLMNILAFGILIITISVNVWIQFSTNASFAPPIYLLISLFPLPWPFSIALIVPASRRILGNRYKEIHRLDSHGQQVNFSSKELVHHVKKYWMMAETGNPQFVIACSSISSAFGVICSLLVCISLIFLITLFSEISNFWHGESDYKWSIDLIITVQSIGVIIGSIAPIFRWLTSISYFSLSKKWSRNHLNVFKVEKHWIRKLQQWKDIHVLSLIPGFYCKIVFHNLKNIILNFCIALQITIVVTCKTICLIPVTFMILFSYCWHCCKSLLKKEETIASDNNVRSEMEQYTRYALQIEDEAKLSKRILRNALKAITRVLHESEKKEPSKLMKLLEKSTGFDGVVDFDNEDVPPLHTDAPHRCWSLVAITLTGVALALPNIEKCNVKGFLASMSEGLEFVQYIEESLNANDDLVEVRKTSRRVWTEVELYGRWLQIDLQKNALKGKTSKEILRCLADEMVKTVIEHKSYKNGNQDQSPHKLIAASSMYRISETILLHCNDQENWPTDVELFEWISVTAADILCACFTNLPSVIKMKCHDVAIEKREHKIKTAAQLLGRSKKILKMLKARQLPKLDADSMAYIDKWHTLSKSEIQMPSGSSSSGTDSDIPDKFYSRRSVLLLYRYAGTVLVKKKTWSKISGFLLSFIRVFTSFFCDHSMVTKLRGFTRSLPNRGYPNCAQSRDLDGGVAAWFGPNRDSKSLDLDQVKNYLFLETELNGSVGVLLEAAILRAGADP
uniref:uncharacterized protein LOC122583736 n=1 Tax=Erigeron canadensis TaxID=72917 RepID=UPI001CB9A796|nr:uncharacterized protein LOC122583736 [Erigeron canadensis]